VDPYPYRYSYPYPYPYAYPRMCRPDPAGSMGVVCALAVCGTGRNRKWCGNYVSTRRIHVGKPIRLGVNCGLCGENCALSGVNCALCGVNCGLCGENCALSGMNCALCGVNCGPCGVKL